MYKVPLKNKLLTGDLAKVMCKIINDAENSIYLSCYYIQQPIINPCTKIRSIFSALEATSKRGLNVKILLDHHPENAKQYVPNLLAARWLLVRNIPVRYLPRGTTLHAKLLIVDDNYIITGSHNLSPTGLERNVEISFLITDPSLATAASSWFLRYWNKSIDFSINIQ